MSLTTFFRRLLLLYIAFLTAELVASEVTASWLPETLRKYHESELTAAEADPEIVLLATVYLVTLLLLIISLIGLWNFWPPARWLYGTTILLSVLLTGLSGPFVVSALTNTLGYIENVLSGLILAVVYFSPIKEYFEPRSAEPVPPPDAPV
jgi:hypothetical protein